MAPYVHELATQTEQITLTWVGNGVAATKNAPCCLSWRSKQRGALQDTLSQSCLKVLCLKCWPRALREESSAALN